MKLTGGQAMIEFSVTLLVFLVVTFYCISTGLYAVERGVAVTSAGAAARLAAGASPTDPNQPDLAAASPLLVSRLQQAVVGTRIQVQPAGQPCDQDSMIPAETVEVCSYLDPSDPSMVVVGVHGHEAVVVPFAFPWGIDEQVELHRETFQR